MLRQARDEREDDVLRALFVTLVVVVSVKVVLVTLSVKVPSPVGGGGNSSDKSFDAGLTMAPSFPSFASRIMTVTSRPAFGPVLLSESGVPLNEE